MVHGAERAPGGSAGNGSSLKSPARAALPAHGCARVEQRSASGRRRGSRPKSPATGAVRSVPWVGVYGVAARTASSCLKAGLHAYRPEKVHSIPHRWRAAVVRWEWHARVAAWDAAERERLRAEYEADRRAARAEQIRLLNAANRKLEAALAALDPADATWSDVTAAIKLVCAELRREEADALVESEASQDAALLGAEDARAELLARLDAIDARRGEGAPTPPD